MDGSFSGKSTMHVVLMTWMEAVKFVRIRWFFFFFSSIFFFFFAPFFSSAMPHRIFDDRFEQGWNGSRVEWEMGIWMSDLEISSFSISSEIWKKICRNGFFFFACCRACDVFFFFYLWIWFIATSNTSLQLVIISISQRCRKFTTFCLIKFVI